MERKSHFERKRESPMPMFEINWWIVRTEDLTFCLDKTLELQ